MASEVCHIASVPCVTLELIGKCLERSGSGLFYLNDFVEQLFFVVELSTWKKNILAPQIVKKDICEGGCGILKK